MFSVAELANLSPVLKISYKLKTFQCGSYATLSVELFI